MIMFAMADELLITRVMITLISIVATMSEL